MDEVIEAGIGTAIVALAEAGHRDAELGPDTGLIGAAAWERAAGEGP